jgi:ribulose-5-phosphate 4-epimerase/fuculose-1-phosphate aldolase
MNAEHRAREEICRVGRSLFERGYAHATAGNSSVRLHDGGYLITPTDACLGFLDPAQLSRVDAQGQHTGGARPSKTLVLHRAVYSAATRFDHETRCVIHTHSTNCVSLSLSCTEAELLPPITPYFVMKVGHVPLIPYHRPGDGAVGDLVTQKIIEHGEAGHAIRAVMLQRLGPNVWHDSPASAMAVLEELEETARLMVLARTPPAPLDADQIAELRRTFGARW